jgi:erythromycin esterase-like protein
MSLPMSRKSFNRWFNDSVEGMATDIKDTAQAVETAAVMRLLPARPRLLALGEPTHGEDTLLDLRNELFRQLVEQEGYRTITIESDCMMGLVVDDHITSGTGTLDEVMEQGISHGWGTFAANRELVRWMRAYNVRADNDGRPASERLRFAGFDGPLEISHAASPRQALTALHGYLSARVDADLLPCTADTLDRLLGTDGRWTDPAAMMDPGQSTGQSAEAGQLRLLADDLVALLDQQTPHLLVTTSRDDWDRARLYGRTATGLLRYHHWMADTSPARMTRLLGVRDQMMAHNLLGVAERGPALVHAHNSHLQRTKSSMRMGGMPLEWWSAGALVSARLGEEYAFVATALGTIRHQGVDTPPPDTVEGLLYALPEDRCVIDAARLATAVGETRPAPRVSPWFGYAPLDPAHLADSDGIVFVRDVPQSRPRPFSGIGRADT